MSFGRGGYGFKSCWDSSNLLHQPQSIPLGMVFGNLAVDDLKDRHPRVGDLFASRGDALPCPLMCASGCEASHDLISFRDQILDCMPNIGKSCSERSDIFFDALGVDKDFFRNVQISRIP